MSMNNAFGFSHDDTVLALMIFLQWGFGIGFFMAFLRFIIFGIVERKD